jgi:dipeptidyl aminopeptidase/acylaminoacyl peptidase
LIYFRASLPGLLQERTKAGFKTKLVENNYQPAGPAAAAEGFEIVRYPSPAGELAAYLSPDPGDGKKHPAVLWAHSGFNGIAPATAEQAKPFVEAGCVVMCPSWRGENDNPGKFELFGGEVEDAVAALNYLAQLPYVDASRLYMAGQGTGGTITLLAAASTPLLRGAFSMGGAPDIANVLRNGGYEHIPFDKASDVEVKFRSPVNWVSLIRAPLWYFEGEKSFYVTDAKWMEASAQRQGVALRAYIIERNDHATIVNPLVKAIAQKIQNDTGPTVNIAFSSDELKDLFPPETPIGVTKMLKIE